MFELLAGIKVVDLTTMVLGPYATQLLGDLGADVIKVESPAGDVYRAVRPGRREDLGVAFLNFNRNKRSISIDIKKDRGRKIIHDMVQTADVFVHNMRLSSAQRLGVAHEQLTEINPQLVYCYSPGFGKSGPDRDAPAYDDIIQARSGLAALNSDADGAPHFVRTIACDKVVGLHLALAVVSGVLQRQRTGRGVCIEAPMLETMASFLLSEHLAGHTLVPPAGDLGYDRVMSSHRKPYRTKDGYLAILPYNTRHWVRFFDLVDRPDLAADPKVTDPVLRSENIDELYRIVAKIAPTRTTGQWLELLSSRDIPCSVVNSLEDLFSDPHLEETELFYEVDDSRVGRLKQVRSPFEIDDEWSHNQRPARPAPGLGEHTRQILEELEYRPEDIEQLIDDNVVVAEK